MVSTVTWTGRAPSCPGIEWTWSFYAELNRADLRVVIDQEEVHDKEEVQVIFRLVNLKLGR